MLRFSSGCDICHFTNTKYLPSTATFLSDFNTATQLSVVLFQCIGCTASVLVQKLTSVALFQSMVSPFVSSKEEFIAIPVVLLLKFE